MGDSLSVLAIKALLIHGAAREGHSPKDVGWGRVPENLTDLITCGSGVARIVYQGSLNPGKYLRAPLPIPKGGLTGNVLVKATFCFATPTDPHHSGSYTRAGLEVVFRPNDGRKKEDAANAASRSFFSRNEYADEHSRRSDAGKWETVLHAEAKLRGRSLIDPVFDIHYIARQDGGPSRTSRPLAYALVVTIEAPRHADLFGAILAEYENLVPIEPEVSLPIRV